METARDIMSRRVFYVAPDTPLVDAYRIMAARKIRHVPVVRANRLLGIISDRDILPHTRAAKPGLLVVDTLRASDVMTESLITCAPSVTVGRIAGLLLDNHIDCVPIVRDSGDLIGIVTTSDLLMLLLPPYRPDEAVIPFDFQLSPLSAAA